MWRNLVDLSLKNDKLYRIFRTKIANGALASLIRH